MFNKLLIISILFLAICGSSFAIPDSLAERSDTLALIVNDKSNWIGFGTADTTFESLSPGDTVYMISDLVSYTDGPVFGVGASGTEANPVVVVWGDKKLYFGTVRDSTIIYSDTQIVTLTGANGSVVTWNNVQLDYDYIAVGSFTLSSNSVQLSDSGSPFENTIYGTLVGSGAAGLMDWRGGDFNITFDSPPATNPVCTLVYDYATQIRGDNNVGLTITDVTSNRPHDIKFIAWGGGGIFHDPTNSNDGPLAPGKADDTLTYNNQCVDLHGFRITIEGFVFEVYGDEAKGIYGGSRNYFQNQLIYNEFYNYGHSYYRRDQYSASPIYISDVRGVTDFGGEGLEQYTGDPDDLYHTLVRHNIVHTCPHAGFVFYARNSAPNRVEFQLPDSGYDEYRFANSQPEPYTMHVMYYLSDTTGDMSYGRVATGVGGGGDTTEVHFSGTSIPPLDSIKLEVIGTNYDYGQGATETDSFSLKYYFEDNLAPTYADAIMFTKGETDWEDTTYEHYAINYVDTNQITVDARNDRYTYPSGYFHYGIGNSYALVFVYAAGGTQAVGNTLLSGTNHLGGEGILIATPTTTNNRSKYFVIKHDSIDVHQGADMYYGPDHNCQAINIRQSNMTYLQIDSNFIKTTNDTSSATEHTAFATATFRFTPTDGPSWGNLIRNNRIIAEGGETDSNQTYALVFDAAWTDNISTINEALIKDNYFEVNGDAGNGAVVVYGFVNYGSNYTVLSSDSFNITSGSGTVTTFQLGWPNTPSRSHIVLDPIFMGSATYTDVDENSAGAAELTFRRTLKLYAQGSNSLPVVSATIYAINNYGDTVTVGTTGANGKVEDTVSFYHRAIGSADSTSFNNFSIVAISGVDTLNSVLTVGPTAAGGTDTLTLSSTTGTGTWDAPDALAYNWSLLNRTDSTFKVQITYSNAVGTVDFVKLLYGTVNDISDAGRDSVSDATGLGSPDTLEVSGLTAETKYYYWGVIQDDDGEHIDAVDSVTTLVYPSLVQDWIVIDTGYDSFILEATYQYAVGTIDLVKVIYDTKNDITSIDRDSVSDNTDLGSPDTLSITGLLSSTKYYWWGILQEGRGTDTTDVDSVTTLAEPIAPSLQRRRFENGIRIQNGGVIVE